MSSEKRSSKGEITGGAFLSLGDLSRGLKNGSLRQVIRHPPAPLDRCATALFRAPSAAQGSGPPPPKQSGVACYAWLTRVDCRRSELPKRGRHLPSPAGPGARNRQEPPPARPLHDRPTRSLSTCRSRRWRRAWPKRTLRSHQAGFHRCRPRTRRPHPYSPPSRVGNLPGRRGRMPSQYSRQTLRVIIPPFPNSPLVQIARFPVGTCQYQ